eukprot:TRINITY_DN73164_c0_g1_i1.p1 TRINITY_DN73164_c0_g1~~TRINITY_DN73164_c0_g1_i1.p1  ORF type:complete len:340 (+),score=52.94 TRINITY_DN73164_c0_g1_i1:93-1112(+)
MSESGSQARDTSSQIQLLNRLNAQNAQSIQQIRALLSTLQDQEPEADGSNEIAVLESRVREYKDSVKGLIKSWDELQEEKQQAMQQMEVKVRSALADLRGYAEQQYADTAKQLREEQQIFRKDIKDMKGKMKQGGGDPLLDNDLDRVLQMLSDFQQDSEHFEENLSSEIDAIVSSEIQRAVKRASERPEVKAAAAALNQARLQHTQQLEDELRPQVDALKDLISSSKIQQQQDLEAVQKEIHDLQDQVETAMIQLEQVVEAQRRQQDRGENEQVQQSAFQYAEGTSAQLMAQQQQPSNSNNTQLHVLSESLKGAQSSLMGILEDVVNLEQKLSNFNLYQ